MGSGFVFGVTPFYFLRHGETPESEAGILQGQSETVLSAAGRKTAEQAALHLVDRDIGSIYHSTLRRATTTATIVSAMTGAPRFPLPGLMERFWGKYQGHPKDERPETADPDTVEPEEAFRQRVLDAMESIGGPSPVLVIAHSGVFRVLARHMGLTSSRTMSISNADVVLIEPPARHDLHWHISAVTS